jgi:hypothetical protein
MTTTASKLHATVKMRKQNAPIRPVINWKNCPACNVRKLIRQNLKEKMNLPYRTLLRIRVTYQRLKEDSKAKAIELKTSSGKN